MHRLVFWLLFLYQYHLSARKTKCSFEEFSAESCKALAVLNPGAIFGEMALLDDTPRSADARVHERVALMVINRESFEDLLFLNKALAYEVLWSMVRILTSRLRQTTDKLTFLSVSSKF